MLIVGETLVSFDRYINSSEIFFDNTTKKICTVRSNGEMGVNIKSLKKHEPKLSFRLPGDQPIKAVKVSIDSKMVGILRTPERVEIVLMPKKPNGVMEETPAEVSSSFNTQGSFMPPRDELSLGIVFHLYPKKSEYIEGFEWVSPDKILLILKNGLEIFQLNGEKKTTKLLCSTNITSSWHVYFPEKKIVFLITGLSKNNINPFSVEDGTKIKKLAMFEVDYGCAKNGRVLEQENIMFAVIYEKMYCLVDRSKDDNSSDILLYEISSNINEVSKVKYILNYNYFGSMACHVIDNIINLHCKDDKITYLFDIGINGNDLKQHPVCGQKVQVHERLKNFYEDINEFAYSEDWVTFSPDYIIDQNFAIFTTLKLDYSDFQDHISDPMTYIRLYLNRSTTPNNMLETVCLFTKQKRFKLKDFTQMFGWFFQKAENDVYRKVKITNEQIENFLLLPLSEEDTFDKQFLVDIALEFLFIANEHGIKLRDYTPELIVKILVNAEQYSKLQQLLQYKVIPDSKQLALKVYALGCKHTPFIGLSLDILARTENTAEYIIEILIDKGNIVEALKYMELHKSDAMDPMRFLMAASSTTNRQIAFVMNETNTLDDTNASNELITLIRNGARNSAVNLVEQFGMLQQLFAKDGNLLMTQFDQVIELINLRHQSCLTFVIDTVSKGCALDSSLFPKAIPVLVTAIENNSVEVQKRTVIACTNLYPLILKWVMENRNDATIGRIWDQFDNLVKKKILSVIEHVRISVRVFIIKFMESIVMCQTIDNKEVSQDSTFSLKDVLRNHRHVSYRKIQNEGDEILRKLCSGVSHKSLQVVTVTLASLSKIARRRTSTATTVLDAYLSFVRIELNHFTDYKLRSLKKQIKMDLARMLCVTDLSSSTDLIAKVFEQMGFTGKEIEKIKQDTSKAAKAELKRKATGPIRYDFDYSGGGKKIKLIAGESESTVQPNKEEEAKVKKQVEDVSKSFGSFIFEEAIQQIILEKALDTLIKTKADDTIILSKIQKMDTQEKQNFIEDTARKLAAAKTGYALETQLTIDKSQGRHIFVLAEPIVYSSPSNSDLYYNPLRNKIIEGKEKQESLFESTFKRLLKSESMMKSCGVMSIYRSNVVNYVTKLHNSKSECLEQLLLDFIMEKPAERDEIAYLWMEELFKCCTNAEGASCLTIDSKDGLMDSELALDRYTKILDIFLDQTYAIGRSNNLMLQNLLVKAPVYSEKSFHYLKTLIHDKYLSTKGFDILKRVITLRPTMAPRIVLFVWELSLSHVPNVFDQCITLVNEVYSLPHIKNEMDILVEKKILLVLNEEAPQELAPHSEKVPWTDSNLKSILSLFMEVLVLNSSLFKQLFKIYFEGRNEVKKAVLGSIDKAVLQHGMQNEDILSAIEACPPNAESLVVKIVSTLVTTQIPSPRLVKSVIEQYEKNQGDVRLLVPILVGVRKEHFLSLLPKFFQRQLSATFLPIFFKKLLTEKTVYSDQSMMSPYELFIAILYLKDDELNESSLYEGINVLISQLLISSNDVSKALEEARIKETFNKAFFYTMENLYTYSPSSHEYLIGMVHKIGQTHNPTQEVKMWGSFKQMIDPIRHFYLDPIDKELLTDNLRKTWIPSTEDGTQCIQVFWFGLGSMMKESTFGCRSQYGTGPNHFSTNELSYLDTTSNYAAGNHQLLSYMDLSHKRQLLTLDFCVPIPFEVHKGKQNLQGYRTHIRYRNIHKIIIDLDDKNSDQIVYYIQYKRPLLYWQAIPSTFNSVRIMNTELCRNWKRVFEWSKGNRTSGCSREIMARCNIIAIAVPRDNTLRSVKSFKRGIFVKEGDDAYYSEIMAEFLYRLHSDFDVIIEHGKIDRFFMKHVALIEPPLTINFSINYAFAAINSRSFYITDQLFKLSENGLPLFYVKVLERMKVALDATVFTLNRLLTVLDVHPDIELIKTFEFLFLQTTKTFYKHGKRENNEPKNYEIPSNCVEIRKAVISPSRIILLAPEVMMANRVVRKFGEECALRVLYRDDDGNKIHVKGFFCGKYDNNDKNMISNTISGPMLNGIQIGPYHYNFLAWSNSQMRDHGCYFYRSPTIKDFGTGDMTTYSIDDIRMWMGDFTKCTSLPKMMSRMGQCFTQTQPTLFLTKEDWIVEDDIYGGYSEHGTPYIFSDGCGYLSYSMAVTLALRLGLGYVPSVFQFRFRGFKGILSVNLNLGKNDERHSIVFRNSQRKFEMKCGEESDCMEIVKYSMPSVAAFNRQLVMILDQVGYRQNFVTGTKISKALIMYFVKEMNHLYNSLFFSELAAKLAGNRCHSHIDFNFIHECGVDVSKEPFFRQMILSVFDTSTRSLIKLKLDFPYDSARIMYGMVDESGTLQPGQVFIQYSDKIDEPMKCIIQHLGQVMITKHPCHSPGDVRLFDAVDVPSLRHLVDVVVFPQYGWRPHADQMAGSDLDGDEYVIIFDKDLYFDHNEKACSFEQPPTNSSITDKPIILKAMADFFANYITNDSLGIISNSHLIQSDKRGLYHPICTELARKCSIAVDFSKTGIHTPPITKVEKSYVVPDFIQSNSSKPQYPSRRVIGILYRRVEVLCKFGEHLQKERHVTKYIDDDLKASICDVLRFKDTHESIKQIYAEYVFRMEMLMVEYSIDNEASIVCNSILYLKRISDMEKMDFTFYHSEKIVELRYKSIIALFRKRFFDEFGGEEHLKLELTTRKDFKITKVMEGKAKLWYSMAYESCSEQVQPHTNMRSFAWIIWDILGQIKNNAIKKRDIHGVDKSQCSK
uniref:RNA-directed RNA polymerase n=1 Tax=Rhabditophanes sp. KR3021 TaxID=114890 RepID=A0AC35U2S7_9BILA